MIIQSDIKQDINRLFKSINRDILDEFSEEKIYPYVIRSNTSKEKELFIRKWYIDKVSEICQKHINNSPFKRVSMAYFYLHDSTFNPFNILNFEKYKSGGLLEKTFWNMIIERYYDNLIVKLVDKLSDNLIMFSNITRYIHSNEAIWNPLCSSIMDALLYNYNTNKWFIDSIISLKNDPEMSFEDFYTKVKYCGNEEDIEHYNIYAR